MFKGMDYWKCIQLFGLIFVLKLRSNALALYWKTMLWLNFVESIVEPLKSVQLLIFNLKLIKTEIKT